MENPAARLDIHWQVGTIQRLAYLNFDGWDKEASPNAHNVTRLDPLLAAIPAINGRERIRAEDFAGMGFPERMAVLTKAANLASARTNGYVERTLDRLYSDRIADEALASVYDKLERVWFLESPYLDSQHKKRLEVELPLVKAVAEDYASNKERQVARRMELERRRLESQGLSQDGGLLEAQEPDAPVKEFDPGAALDFSDLRPGAVRLSPPSDTARAQEVQELRDRFFAARDIEAMRAANWPAEEIKLLYFERLKKAAERADPSDFKMHLDGAFDAMERIIEDFFRDFRKVGKLGPWARTVARLLERQATELYDQVHSLRDALALELEARGNGDHYPRSKYYEWDKKRLDGSINLIRKREDGLSDFWARSGAHEATNRLLWYEQADWDADGSMAPHLIALVDYYRNRTAQAARDKRDPGHLREVLDEMRYGEYAQFNALNIMALDELTSLWLRASRQRGNLRALGWGAAARMALAVLLNGAWLAGLLYVLPVAVPQALLVAMPIYSGLLLAALLAKSRFGMAMALLISFGGLSLLGSALAAPAFAVVASAWGVAMVFAYLLSAGKVETLRRFKNLGADLRDLSRR